MSFTKDYTVDKTIFVPLYEGDVKKFIAIVDLTILDEWPVKWQITDKPDFVNDNAWKWATSGTSSSIVDSSKCTHCYLILDPITVQAVAHVRVDFDFSPDVATGGNGDNGKDYDVERLGELKTAAITFLIILAIVIALIIFVMKKMKARPSV